MVNSFLSFLKFQRMGMSQGVIVLIYISIISMVAGCGPGDRHTPNGSMSNTVVILNTLSEDFSVYDGKEIRNHIAKADAGANDVIWANNEIFAINSLSNSISVYDRNLELKYEVSTGESTNPFKGIYKDGYLYITAYLKDQILVMGKDGKWKLEDVIDINGIDLPVDDDSSRKLAPMGIATDGRRIYVALANLNENAVAAGPGGIYIGKDNDWSLITTDGRDTVNVVCLGKLMAFVSAGDYKEGEGFVGNGKIDLYDPVKSEIIRSVDISAAPFAVTGPEDGKYFVSDAMGGDFLIYDEDWELLKKVVISETQPDLTSDFLLENGMLLGLEFNSNTFFIFNTALMKFERKFKTGDGPISIKKLKGGLM